MTDRALSYSNMIRIATPTGPMTRRDFFKAAGTGAAALSLSSLPAWVTEEALGASGSRPNIILIMADDLGYECLGANGGTSYKTPYIDELARTGMRFENCHSTPLCTPSRVHIMTGRYSFRNFKKWARLDPNEVTFGHVLKNAGYSTCIAGKWQLGGGNEGPHKAGFDEYCLWFIDKETRGSGYHDPTVVINKERHENLKGKYGPDVHCNFIKDFMKRNKSKPFFVYYPMFLTHYPNHTTPDWKGYDKSSGMKLNGQQFADMVKYMDKIVGQITKELTALKLREKTLILFTGDNGTYEITSKMGNKEVEGGKGLTIHTGTHVPLVANWKGTIPAGKVNPNLIDFSDMLPTLAETGRAGLPRNVKIDGKSFLGQLQGKPGKPREWIFCHYHPGKGKFSKVKERYAFDTKWKLYESGKFFNLVKDPMEQSPIPLAKLSGKAKSTATKFKKVIESMK